MKVSSRKAKGRRLQQWVKDQLVKHLALDPDKIHSAVMGETGADVRLDKDIEDRFPYSIECKAQEKYKGVYDILNQAAGNAKKDHQPIGFIRMNRRPALVVMEAEEFFRIYNVR